MKAYTNRTIATTAADDKVTCADRLNPIMVVVITAAAPRMHTPPTGDITSPTLLATAKVARLSSLLQQLHKSYSISASVSCFDLEYRRASTGS